MCANDVRQFSANSAIVVPITPFLKDLWQTDWSHLREQPVVVPCEQRN